MARLWSLAALFLLAVPASALPLPPPPNDVQATPQDDGTVRVTWAPVAEAVLYRVYRDGQLLGQVDVPEYVDVSGPGLVAYAVTSVRDGVESLPSPAAVYQSPCLAVGGGWPPLYVDPETCIDELTPSCVWNDPWNCIRP